MQPEKYRQWQEHDHDVLDQIRETYRDPGFGQIDAAATRLPLRIPHIGHWEAAEEDFKEGSNAIEDSKNHDAVCTHLQPSLREDDNIEVKDGELDKGVTESPFGLDSKQRLPQVSLMSPMIWVHDATFRTWPML